MADFGLFIGRGSPRSGKEIAAVKVFEEGAAYCRDGPYWRCSRVLVICDPLVFSCTIGPMSGQRSTRPWIALLTVPVLGALLGACSLFGGPTPTPTPIPTPTPTPTTGPCDVAGLAARITSWDAGAGHRFASVELTNVGAGPCLILAMSQPQLVDGTGAVLTDAGPPAASAVLTFAPDEILKTAVDVANYCGPSPVPPVTVAFVLAVSGGRIVAAPLWPTDTSGVPQCSGASVPAEIQMQPWAP